MNLIAPIIDDTSAVFQKNKKDKSVEVGLLYVFAAKGA